MNTTIDNTEKLPVIYHIVTGARFALLVIKEHCNARGCDNQRQPQSLLCIDCYMQGWQEE